MIFRSFVSAATLFVAACYNPDVVDLQPAASEAAPVSVEAMVAEEAFQCLIGDEHSFETLLKHHRAILVGELHGTAEMPAAFGDIVEKAVANGRRVAVALEFDRRWQADIDAVMAAPDQTAAEAAFAGRATFDGRTSAAMRELLYRLREIKQQGADLHVFAIDFWEFDSEPRPLVVPEWLPEEVDVGKALRDIRMGEKAAADCLAIECDTLMFFAGSMHTRRLVGESSILNSLTGEITPFVTVPAGAIVANEMQTVTIALASSGGTAKVNAGSGLKVHQWQSTVPEFVTREEAFFCASPSFHHDLVYNVGDITASSDPTQSRP